MTDQIFINKKEAIVWLTSVVELQRNEIYMKSLSYYSVLVTKYAVGCLINNCLSPAQP